ncbi:MAG: hypothetical protein IPL12_12780 [Bacteroidetes bacterium]|nr:hypothetical protein [Bacteroidota bacterium]
MKPPLLIFLIVVFTLTSFTQIYTIPDAEQQPAWVFPLWFEDGTGARDTIYFAYDEYAIDFGIPSADVVFGEDLLPLNLDTFNVFWDEIIIGKAHKVVVFKTITAPIIISFLNAHLPLKITWDNNLFYSNMLPFANNFPLPNAWGRFIAGLAMILMVVLQL